MPTGDRLCQRCQLYFCRCAFLGVREIMRVTEELGGYDKEFEMFEKRIEEGDVVCLKSGGPKMTVVEISDSRGPNDPPVGTATVAWFDGHDYREAYGVSVRALVKAEKL